MAKMVILPDLVDPGAITFFVIGKVVRFLLYFWFVFSVASQTKMISGYTPVQIVSFFLVFTIIDSLTQLIFRGVYLFRPLVVSGDFDLDLLKPLPSFFRPLFGRFDLADFLTIFPFLGFSVWFMVKNSLVNGLTGLFSFLLLLMVSFILTFAFHLFVCAICVLTMEIDYLIWVYRDLTAMARFPTDIYHGFVRFLVTFVIPVVLIITFPAKGLLGLLSWQSITVAIAVSLILAYFSLKFWYWSLKRYTSASS